MHNQKYSAGKPYKAVAFCLSCFSDDEQTRLIQAAQKKSKEHNCKVVFFSTLSDFYYDDINDRGEKKIFDAISVERFDAIVLMSESFKRDEDQKVLVERARAAGIPVLAVDKRLEHCINLRFGYGDSFREVVKHMVEFHGYRTVNFMAGFEGNVYSDERLQVYREVLQENGIPVEEERIYYGGFWEEPTREAMEKMFASPLPMARAIICANDSMALAVCRCLREKGYRVPEDVAVSGFDGITMERYSRPRLTTAKYNYEKMITTIFEIIDRDIPAGRLENPVTVYNKMQIGGSCGCEEVEPIDAGAELVRMKNQLYLEARFHEFMNYMVANLGNEEDIRNVVNSVHGNMKLMAYKKFWFCVNENFVHYMMSVNRASAEWIPANRTYTDQLKVIYYDGEKGAGIGDYMSFGDIVPGLPEILDAGDCLMVVPVHLKGETLGYGAVLFDEDRFTYTLFASFLVNFRYLLEMQKNRVRLADVYMKDSLSGLYNRNGFYDLILKVMDRDADKDLAVISLDMDRLKMVNDTYGHAEGDVALQHIAKIVESTIEGNEIGARIGGDEFLIAFSGKEVEERAEQIVKIIRQTLERYNLVSGKRYKLQASIGAYTNRISGHTLDHFLKKADDLMYADKYLHRKEKGDIRY